MARLANRSDGGTPWPDLDGTDLAVIAALQHDGRASMAGLARHLGVPVSAARQRYERLRERGLVQAIALVDPAALGRHVVAHLAVTVRTDVRATALALRERPEVAWLAIGADHRTVHAQVSTASNAALSALLDDGVRGLPGVHTISSAILLRNWAPVFRFGPVAPGDEAPAEDALWRRGDLLSRPVDDVDSTVLRCLERDARMTLTAIAEQAGLSVPATRQRLVRLVGDRVVRFRTRPSPLADGVEVARLVVGVDAGSTDVAQRLLALPNVSYVSEATGEAVLTAELVCANSHQLDEGYESACRTPGVTDVRVVRYREVLVHSGRW